MHKIITFSLTVLLIGSSLLCDAQRSDYSTGSRRAIKFYEEAVNYIARRQLMEALGMLQQAIAKDESFIEAHLEAAFVYKMMNNVERQKKHLNAVLKHAQHPQQYKNVYYSLGEANFLLQEYDSAITLLEYFLSFPTADPRIIPEAQKIIKNAEFAREAIKEPVDFDPVKLPEIINSGPLQYFPVLTADEKAMYFTRREGHQPYFDEDIYVARKNDKEEWTEPGPISSTINTDYNEGTCTISADERVLIFTNCMGRRGFGSCDLFISYREGTDWSRPVNMGENINSRHWDSQPSLSADGRKLYFVSERPGGQGNRDIWMSYTNEQGRWQPAINLGPSINTPADDVSPFIHVNGQTLYYASKGLLGFGGYDLYSTEYKNGVWTEPKNLGYPVNTPEDQVSLFVAANGKRAYYSLDSYTRQGFPISMIYYFDLPEEISVSKRSYYVTGTILDDETREPLKARVELMDVDENELISRIYSDSIFGEYTMVLTEGFDYALYVDKEGYIFESRHFSLPEGSDYEPIRMDFFLKKTRAGAIATLNNLFFDVDKYELKTRSITELEKIMTYMKKYPDMTIEIRGHTDNTGSAEYNMELSIKRAEAVYNYLTDHGIDPERLTYEGFGQTKPAFPNDTEENRSRNRRIEFMVLDI